MRPAPLLRLVDENGEIQERPCPQCEHRENILVQYEKDIRILKATKTKLEREIETDARNDPLWDEAEALHTWWRLACWYPQTIFADDDFWLVKKHLKRASLIGCLEAICGAAYDPFISWGKNGREQRHHKWHKIWESKSQMEDFAGRVPGREGSSDWKRWLVTHIESNLG